MKYLISIVFLILPVVFYGQATYDYDEEKISRPVKRIVYKIAKINELMSSAVYYEGIRPKQYDNFISLKEKASREELTELTNYPNAVVRCYSFWALAYDQNADLFTIVVKHINDNESVRTQVGCIGSSERAGDFFVSVVTPRYVDNRVQKFNEIQMAALDSILIHTPNKLLAKSDALRRTKASDDIYPAIRELVIKNKDQSALVALAKYQKEQDIDLILNNKAEGVSGEDAYQYTYQAISEFPHPKFLPFLETHLQKSLSLERLYLRLWKEMYKAIASYKDVNAVKLLTKPFYEVTMKSFRKYHLESVFEAIRRFNAPVYDDLLWRFWKDENMIATDAFKYLTRLDPKQSLELAKRDLLKPKDLYANYMTFEFLSNPGGGDSKSLIEVMLDMVLREERETGISIIRNNLRNIDVGLFAVFAFKAAEIRDVSFVEPLFERLEKEWNAHLYLRATETLLTYDDKAINQRIAEAKNKNANLKKDWGSVEFAKLLKQNNIVQ